MTSQQAIKTLLWILTAVLLFHLSIVIKIIPYDITWGGRLKSDQDMYVFESFSIVVNLFLMYLLAVKGGYLKQVFSIKVVNIILWFFFGLFCLNTVGNIFAETNFEKYFTVVTLVTAWLLWKVLKGKK